MLINSEAFQIVESWIGNHATMTAFNDPNVAARFAEFDGAARARLMQLRQLIFDIAATTSGCGLIEESLKWGVPSYATVRPVSGTPIRLDAGNGKAGLYVHCQTTLVENWRQLYPDVFLFSKNRAILFDLDLELPSLELRHCIAMALTYRINK